jgi:hypothetical protein
MRRCISWFRPATLPTDESRAVRVTVARGSIEYSAVTQPLLLSLRKAGTLSSTLTEHITLVFPSSISAEPSAKLWNLGIIRTGRSSFQARPSALFIQIPLPVFEIRAKV